MFDIFNKFRKRLNLRLSQTKGKFAEDNFHLTRSLQGYEVKRTGHGSDYSERKLNMITGRKGPKTLIEIKSTSTAPLSKLQRKTQKKSSRYKVIRSFWP